MFDAPIDAPPRVDRDFEPVDQDFEPCELTILMPCLNEAETLAACINKAQNYLARYDIDGEVLIADNGSTDGSQVIASALGARVVTVPQKGYGSALRYGILSARGRYVIMGDSDDSYDFSRLEDFVAKLRAGYDLVMGNRFKGGIMPNAMPPLHRYLGNPVLTFIGRLFFNSECGDFHCGLRGFSRSAILRLDLQSTGMEFASEMVVKATIHGLNITEVPTILHPDGRSRPPHLRSWRDGWRHLRFLLLFSPKWLFLYPGLVLSALGLSGLGWLTPETRQVHGVSFDIHTLFYASLALVIGVHTMTFWVFSKIYGMREGIVARDERFLSIIGKPTLEFCLLAGGGLVALGIGLSFAALNSWSNARFGGLNVPETMRVVILSGTAIMVGLHIVFGSFFLNLLRIRASR
jgi:glycosyltransferase involved in cell wall biosynthesis